MVDYLNKSSKCLYRVIIGRFVSAGIGKSDFNKSLAIGDGYVLQLWLSYIESNKRVKPNGMQPI